MSKGEVAVPPRPRPEGRPEVMFQPIDMHLEAPEVVPDRDRCSTLCVEASPEVVPTAVVHWANRRLHRRRHARRRRSEDMYSAGNQSGDARCRHTVESTGFGSLGEFYT